MTTTDKLQALMALFQTAAEAYVEKELLRYRGLNSDSVNERYASEWAALRAALEPLVADAERLDFIARRARSDPKMDGQHVWWPTTFNHALRGPSLRAAIDAARSAEPQAGETKT